MAERVGLEIKLELSVQDKKEVLKLVKYIPPKVKTNKKIGVYLKRLFLSIRYKIHAFQ